MVIIGHCGQGRRRQYPPFWVAALGKHLRIRWSVLFANVTDGAWRITRVTTAVGRPYQRFDGVFACIIEARSRRIGNNRGMRADIDAFCRDGFILLPAALDAELTASCQDAVWANLESQGVRRTQPSSWIEPVVRVRCLDDALISAERSPALAEAYDVMVGAGRWLPPGSPGDVIPVRFPSERQPADVGWHVDGNWQGPDGFHVDVRSTGRGLVVFILLTDTGPDDAPTAMLPGSHLALPRVLEPHGDSGAGGNSVIAELDPAVLCRRMAFATGHAGDAYLCHPFLVHTATWPHRGVEPRMMVSAKLETTGSFALDGSDASPVARLIVASLMGP